MASASEIIDDLTAPTRELSAAIPAYGPRAWEAYREFARPDLAEAKVATG